MIRSEGPLGKFLGFPFQLTPGSLLWLQARPLPSGALSTLPINFLLPALKGALRKGNAKECSNYRTITFISHDSKCSKFSKPGFSNM